MSEPKLSLAAEAYGNFHPILRMYQPRPEALDGTFVLPPIRRIE